MRAGFTGAAAARGAARGRAGPAVQAAREEHRRAGPGERGVGSGPRGGLKRRGAVDIERGGARGMPGTRPAALGGAVGRAVARGRSAVCGELRVTGCNGL